MHIFTIAAMLLLLSTFNRPLKQLKVDKKGSEITFLFYHVDIHSFSIKQREKGLNTFISNVYMVFYFILLKCKKLSCFFQHANFTYGSRSGACSRGAEGVSSSTTASEW